MQSIDIERIKKNVGWGYIYKVCCGVPQSIEKLLIYWKNEILDEAMSKKDEK